MPLRDVADFMGQHAGQLGFARGAEDQADIRADESAGHRKRVDARVAHREECQPVLSVLRFDADARAECLQILVGFRILQQLVLVPQVAQHHAADLEFFLAADERIGRAAQIRQ